MSLEEVHITTEVYYACLSHALITEEEEIMGLLLGNIENTEKGGLKATVWDICTLNRVDKRKDRVEIKAEHLVAASEEAEKLSETTGLKTRVIGWYHSHPHITPWPSHVDLMCQGNYQMMEKGFVGLIFSVFNQDSENMGSIQLHCFQTRNSIEMKEDIMETDKKEDVFSPVKKTEFVKVSIPVNVISSENYPKIGYKRIIQLQETLLNEESMAFNQSILLDDTKKMNPLKIIHNGSIYQKNIVKLLDYFCIPLKTCLEQEISQNAKKLKELEEEEKALLNT